jgi:hypothetical protein
MVQQVLTPGERCCRNVECWLKEKGGPAPTFLTEEHRVAWGLTLPPVQPDRVYLEYSPELLAKLIAESNKWQRGINGKSHRPWGVKTAKDGGRERRGRWSLQWILHRFDQWFLIEIDFDGWNPQGPGAIWEFGHLFEAVGNALCHKKTDPYRVARERGWIDVSSS